MHPKDADGMANSVDPDQTASSEAVWSWSALFAETYLSQYKEFIRYRASNNCRGQRKAVCNGNLFTAEQISASRTAKLAG